MIGPDSSAGVASDDRSKQLVRNFRILLMGVLLAACAARAGALWVWSANLNDDRDIYLSLAQGMAAGRGFSVPGTDLPTAYRPPLYPLLLVVTAASGSAAVRGLLHLLLGTGTVWLTYLLGRRRGLGERLALLAAALVAVDPLLVRYTTFPMTETFVTFLTTALLLTLTSTPGFRRQVMIGLLFGLCVLSRPTLWAFGGLMLLRWVVLWRKTHGVSSGESGRSGEASSPAREAVNSRSRHPVSVPWVTLAVLAVVVSPWVVRNMLAMGHPIVMTTHGGYTLLLGNNPAFYREVVEQPWGTVWDGSVGGGQATWAASINREMDEAGITGEVARDRWMGRRAREHILDDPVLFLKACWLRFRRFWAVTPGGGDASAVPPAFRPLLVLFYGVIYLWAAIGLFRTVRGDLRRWSPSILLVTAFVGVHLVYWSNARMRAPVIPVVALLAARGLQRNSTLMSGPSASGGR